MEKRKSKKTNISVGRADTKKGLRLGTELTQLRVTMGTEEEAKLLKALMTAMMTMAWKVCVDGEG